MFQSLNRAYKRSDGYALEQFTHAYAVSIPQSGLQAFRPAVHRCAYALVGWFQSLNRAYKRSDHIFGTRSSKVTGFNPSIGLTSVPTRHIVLHNACKKLFQSLNRAYKRSDETAQPTFSGYSGAFQSLNRAYKRSDLLL